MGEAVIILKYLFGFCLEQGFIAAKAINDKKVGIQFCLHSLKNILTVVIQLGPPKSFMEHIVKILPEETAELHYLCICVSVLYV